MSSIFEGNKWITTGVVATAVYSIFYCSIAWGITTLIDGGRKGFFWVVGILVAVRVAYFFLEFVAGVIVWQTFGRRKTVDYFVATMRNGKLPKRVYCTDHIFDYLNHIVCPPTSAYTAGEVTPEVQKIAREISDALVHIRAHRGLIEGMRMEDAAQRALEIYSPSEDSPHFVPSQVLNWFSSVAQKSEILTLPNSSAALAENILSQRPFETLNELYQLLRIHGLDQMQAVAFLNSASFKCGWRT